MPYPSAAAFGRGFILQAGDGGSPTEGFDPIAEVRDFDELWPQTRDFEPVTSQDTPGGVEEVKPAVLRTGEMTFEVNFLPTHPTHDPTTGLRADFLNGTRRNFRAIYPPPYNTRRVEFAAYVARYPVAIPVDGIMRGRVVLRLDGVMSEVANP